MSDLRDFTGKNRKFTGTTGLKISAGGTATRVNETGRFRYNSDVNLLEYYTGTDWKSVDAPPVVTTIAINGGSDITSGDIDNEASGDATIVVKGSLFDTSNPTVTFEGSGETLSASSTTADNANQITVTIPHSSFDTTNSPYTVKVQNPSGLSATLADAISADQTAPTFLNAADTTANLFNSNLGAGIPAADLCGANNATAYAVQSGSLPTGLSLNTTTGAITGTANAVGSNTVSTFTIRATGDDATTDRQFKIQVNAPIVSSSTGSGTFTPPSGLSAVNVLVVAGGGGAGSQHAGGGGAGGLIYRPAFPISGPQSFSAGGHGNGGPNTHQPPNGGNSTFGTLTAIGGGGGGHGWPSSQSGKPGGSGGGGPGPGQPGGSGTQPGQSGDSGTYGFGNSGGRSNSNAGGGGGGAGGGGSTSNDGHGQPGGSGRTYNISGSTVTYAGGGGGAGHTSGGAGSGGSGGGGRGGAHPGQPGADAGGHGSGGGGGGFHGGRGGRGSNGIVIYEY